MNATNKKSLAVLGGALALALGNYWRIASAGDSNVRAVELLSILALGAILALFLREVIEALRTAKK